MKIMKRFLVIILGCLQVSFSHAQWFSGEYTTEVQWDLKKHTNWLNHLRLDLAAMGGQGDAGGCDAPCGKDPGRNH